MPSDSCCLVQVRRCLRHLPCHGRHGAVTVALTNPCGGNNVPRMLCYLIALAIYAHHYSHGHHCRRRRDNEWHLLVAKHFNFKDQLRVGLDSPSREATGPVCVVGGAVDLGDFSQRHGDDGLVPSLDDLAHAHAEGERLLACILGGPELGVEIPILAKARAVDRDGLAARWHRAIACADQGLCESHRAASRECLMDCLID
mmetsp:Transcript_17364/g.48107  ORF Transcript_17364/g.48107 Transcript_17364/m.48107 type:complete len:200 (+) Transcript_17364:367-966(+)